MEPRLLHLALLLLLACGGIIAPARGAGGSWKVLQRSVGVSAMHMHLLHNDRVILFDRTNFGRSNLPFPPGHPCRVNPRDRVLPQGDCTAHSVEYSVASNTFRALSIFTDTWCSSGYVAPDGTLVQNGGWEDGYRKVRLMPACNGSDTSCDWSEKPQDPDVLAADRWYATNQKLPDGRAIIVGGLGQSNYEFYPKPNPFGSGTFSLPFLAETNSLYPFVHLNIDGNLFIYANNRAILFDYKNGKIVREYPVLPGAEPRTNPNAGSSVLLPLKPNPTEAEVLICGGAPNGSVDAVQRNTFLPALVTCGRIKITDPKPSWVIEKMPSPRVMGDMILLPNGEVAIINGAKDGIGGWESAKTPAKAPFIYRPDRSLGSRFEEQTAASTARMYHSSAVLLRDGRVLVGGSNPHQFYVFNNVEFPTELGLDAFSPGYLHPSNDALRPKIVSPSPASVTYGQLVKLQFTLPATGIVKMPAALGKPLVTMVAPSFTTHSFAQNQRLLFLQVKELGKPLTRDDAFEASVVMPSKPELAPPGYYMVCVVNELLFVNGKSSVAERFPSEGIWVHIQ
ncbi:aldehyde oxidase GLOX-like [Phragmites australis]|uniref:aldehyde oxidase GLOX-like n=1 Tax=Phragmites australis TaxID=29695 RepID=UPI002D77F8CD|nr:aldehyde oxidase GLOX-like [Phragmites australis]